MLIYGHVCCWPELIPFPSSDSSLLSNYFRGALLYGSFHFSFKTRSLPPSSPSSSSSSLRVPLSLPPLFLSLFPPPLHRLDVISAFIIMIDLKLIPARIWFRGARLVLC